MPAYPRESARRSIAGTERCDPGKGQRSVLTAGEDRNGPLSAKCAVALSGHPRDLEDLRTWFVSGPIQVVEIDVPAAGRVTALLAEEFDGLSSGEQVQAMAPRLVGQLNGVLFASDPDRPPVRVFGIYERTANGDWGHTHVSLVEKLSARDRVTVVLTGPDGLPVPGPPPSQPVWLALASGPTDPNPAADILIALRGEPDWFDLWKAFEIIVTDERKLPNWPTDEIEWFRKTASQYRHSPSNRHAVAGRKWLKKEKKPKMGIRQARHLVARLAVEWLDWQAAGASR